MTKLVDGNRFESSNFASLNQRFFGCESNHKFLVLAFGSRQEVSRNAVSPPKLAANAPVLNILEPVAVGRYVFVGVELDFSFEYGRQSNVGKVLHRQEPLLAKARLNSCVLIALRVAHLVVVVLNFLHQAGIFKVDGNLLANIHTVLSDIESGSLRQCSVGVENIDDFQIVSLSECVVVSIVSGRNFQTASTKFDVNITVFDNRNNTSNERHNNLVTAQPLVFRVFRVDTHRGIAHNCLRTGSGHNSVVAFCILVQNLTLCACRLHRIFGRISHIITQIVEFALLLAVDNLFGAQHGLCFRVPVDHSQTTVY